MSELLRSPRGKVGLTAVGCLLLLAAAWFLVVAPQRSKAQDLATQVGLARNELAQRRLERARPSAPVTVRASDLYRLTKALPDNTDMPGILMDLDRIARGNSLALTSVTPSSPVLGVGYVRQPVEVAVQGRFSDISQFLGDVRTLVTVRDGRLDARGRLYSVSRVEISSPDSPVTFPIVKAAVTLSAFTYSSTSGAAAAPEEPASSDDASSGTVAAGATP